MAQPILEARNLVKTYGTKRAVDDISFAIEEGEVFGLLGPNGAGKSTTIAALTGLFPPDQGSIRILGIDAVGEVQKVKHLIGVVPQDLALYPTLSGRENLRFFGEMYELYGTRLTERVDDVLHIVAMTDRANDPVKSYSGGMKRRINMAVGLINNPRILFLDEPTVGVDPQSRNHIFESIYQLNKAQGMSILYTTHYMEEAERLCDRVAIIDEGKIIAMDTPRRLVESLGGGIIQVGLLRNDEAIVNRVCELSQVKGAAFVPQPEPAAETEVRPVYILKVETRRVNEALIQLMQLFNQLGLEILSVETLAPNLETVFLHLTGKTLRQ